MWRRSVGSLGGGGLSVKWRERALVVGTTGATASMEAACSSIGHRKRSAPPEWHLDCDRSDPETVSSPVPSEGPEEARKHPQVQVQASMERRGREEG